MSEISMTKNGSGWPMIIFILIVMALFTLSSSGCTRQNEGYVGLTNTESGGYFYFKKEYIVTDNTTHFVISIPKSDKGVWIKYSNAY